MKFGERYSAARSRLRQVVEELRYPKQTLASGRFPDKPVRFYRTPTGRYYLPADSRRDVICREIVAGRLFEPEVVEVAKEYVKEGSVVLDVGANVGQMALQFSRFVGEKGLVYAFEADDYVFNILEQNVKANHRHNIRPFFGAVYDCTGRTMYYPVQDFKRFGSYGSYGLDPRATAGRSVTTLRVDDLDIQMPISFMKVDVQGSDLFALRGAVETIRAHQMPIVFEFEQQFQEEFGTTFQDYVDFVSDISYKVVRTVYNINYVIVPNRKRAKTRRASCGAAAEKGLDNILRRHSAVVGDERKKGAEKRLCRFLRGRDEVEQSTLFLQRHGYLSHNLACKNWDLANVLPQIGEGNVLDMGSTDSHLLRNLRLKRIRGELWGVDLREPNGAVDGVNYVKGDLTDTKLPDGHFDNITCLSVVEHGVDYGAFARETARLLKTGGRLYLTFDYWEPRVNAPVDLYGLKWQPLDRYLAESLVVECKNKGLVLVADIDWAIDDAVIRPGYYSPHPKVSYTFGFLVFQKARRTGARSAEA
jgi:FkbM family methyltransferase